jgi:hypothetical protein
LQLFFDPILLCTVNPSGFSSLPDVKSAALAMEALQGKVYPDFGCTTALQVRFADLEVSQQDCIDAAATASATLGDISSKEGEGISNRPTLNTNNLSLGSLNLSSDLAGTGLKFNPCYVNPEPVCVSTTAHVIVPGCSIIEGEEKNGSIMRNLSRHISLTECCIVSF